MSRNIQPMREEHFVALQTQLSRATVLVLEPVQRARMAPEEMFHAKHRWFHEVLTDWGTCGQALVVEGQVLAYVLYAPPSHAPGESTQPTAPASPDCVLLLEAWVDPSHRDAGFGKALIQTAAADLVRRGVSDALEAYGHTGSGSADLLPQGFLEAVGFRVVRPHRRAPRLRMELRGTRRWLSEVEERWERLLGAVRPRKEPATGPPVAGSIRNSVRGA